MAVRCGEQYAALSRSTDSSIKHLILAQAASEAQKKGKPGQLVDPRPEAVEGGEIKIRITPQLVHDIFDEYPIVAKAYSENVPNKVRSFLQGLMIHFGIEGLASSPKNNFGSGIFSPSFLMPIEPPFDLPLPSTLSKTIPSLTNIWKKKMTVSLGLPSRQCC